MNNTKIFKMPFGNVYPMYIHKAEKKGRTKAEVDEIICWLTGYDEHAFQQHLDNNSDFETFFWKGATNQPECCKNYGVDLWLQGRRN